MISCLRPGLVLNIGALVTVCLGGGVLLNNITRNPILMTIRPLYYRVYRGRGWECPLVDCGQGGIYFVGFHLDLRRPGIRFL